VPYGASLVLADAVPRALLGDRPVRAFALFDPSSSQTSDFPLPLLGGPVVSASFMARDLPSLSIFADEIVSALGSDLVRRGHSVLEDVSEYPSAAIALAGSGHHAVLLRDHKRHISISLPLEGDEEDGFEWLWHGVTRAEWSVTNEMRGAIARYAKEHSNAVSMADVIVKLKPILQNQNDGGEWEVSFPGTPVPSESWLRAKDGRAIGFFQEDYEVKVVVWADGAMLNMQVATQGDLANVPDFVITSLKEQVLAQTSTKEEKERRAALSKPKVADVKARLLAGERYSCGGRYHTDYYRGDDGRIMVDISDEGHFETVEASDGAIQSSIDLYPDVFRR
jgi:hypothetical protein